MDKKINILIFTEGTILMHKNAEGKTREEIMWQVKNKEISVHEYFSYIPIGNAVKKLREWEKQGAQIEYLTSRRDKREIEDIQYILDKYNFPKGKLYFREGDQEYKDVAERIMPDILIEDDCESIGGEKEMTYPHIKEELKKLIKPIFVKEFIGIDHLPDNINSL